MDYNRLISVTGMSGLYELISSKSDGALVRSLEDGTTKFASNRVHSFSQIENIEIYTTRENVNLIEVFNAMESNSDELPNEKDSKVTKEYFKNIFPKMDFDRVYDSDRKKMVKWFKIIKEHKIEIKLSEAPAEEEETK